MEYQEHGENYALPIAMDDDKPVVNAGLLQPCASAHLETRYYICFQVIEHFIVNVLTNDSILPEAAERIFGEILTAFPTKMDKTILGKLLIGTVVKIINNLRQTIIFGVGIQKVDLLMHFTTVYRDGGKL
jgi:hypothetical protein